MLLTAFNTIHRHLTSSFLPSPPSVSLREPDVLHYSAVKRQPPAPAADEPAPVEEPEALLPLPPPPPPPLSLAEWIQAKYAQHSVDTSGNFVTQQAFVELLAQLAQDEGRSEDEIETLRKAVCDFAEESEAGAGPTTQQQPPTLPLEVEEVVQNPFADPLEEHPITSLYFTYTGASPGACSPVNRNPTKLAHYFMDVGVWESKTMYACLWVDEFTVLLFCRNDKASAVARAVEDTAPFVLNAQGVGIGREKVAETVKRSQCLLGQEKLNELREYLEGVWGVEVDE